MTTETLARIEAKLDVLITLLSRGEQGIAATSVEPVVEADPAQDARAFFRRFTPKQHAVLQMLLRGAGNLEIAKRLGVAENTAKVHVRSIAKKLGTGNRAVIGLRAWPHWDVISEHDYEMLSGGLPKDWDAKWSEPDPHSHIYYHKVGDEDAEAEEAGGVLADRGNDRGRQGTPRTGKAKHRDE